MDPLKLFRSAVTGVVLLLCLAYALRWSYELVRPLLPLVIVGGTLLAVWRLVAVWRRGRW